MFVLNATNSIANTFLAELRDQNIQKDRLRFRHNLKRLGGLLAYEVSKSFSYHIQGINTALGMANIELSDQKPVLISIMRAAMPFCDGFSDMFDRSDIGFIGAARKDNEGNKIEVNLSYTAAPDLNGKTVIIVDPMLATGKSLLKSIETLETYGKPEMIHIASLIAAPEGVEYLKGHLRLNYQFWVCALDEKLNEKSYIVPGLGDAGDLAFGAKV